ncbi:MAG: amidophosphoribosyltransferase, partial [Kiritimatiellae bacterium]|nr:amidophosphoribosyltransferase [Kiritimatiellia bacterium]
MTDELKHECAVAMVVLRKSAVATGDFGGTKLSLLLEKQHNRGQDGAGAAILSANPEPGETPYWIAKSASATPLADVLAAIGKRVSRKERIERKGAEHSDADNQERIFLGHLRYATFGKNDVAFCHPFVHESSELDHTILLAGNFNLTNAHELFDDYRHHGSFPTSKSDGYLITSLIAKQLEERSAKSENHISKAISAALANADGAWTLCGMTADGWAFATRDPHGIRPGWHYIDDDVVVVASERAAIQAAFDVPPEAVKELPPGEALVVSPEGDVEFVGLNRAEHVERAEDKASNLHVSARSTRLNNLSVRPCSFERIYFSRANDADIHRERKALGAALVPRILEAANAPMDRIFFSYIPNSARIAFHGLLEELFRRCFLTQRRRGAEYAESDLNWGYAPDPKNPVNLVNPVQNIPRFGEVAVKDAKFRTFIADAAARREFYKHVYDVTYGLVKKDDTLVVLDDSIVRGNTMKNAILPMLDRLGPKRIVIASSAPPIRYPDCYGIDMSTLGELVAFRALVNLLDGDRGMGNGERELREALAESEHLHDSTCSTRLKSLNPLASLYA